MVASAPVVARALTAILIIGLAACQPAASPLDSVGASAHASAPAASASTAAPTSDPSAQPAFGDLVALRRLLEDGGFRASVSAAGLQMQAAGTGVRVTIAPDPMEPDRFRSVSLEIQPLSILDTDPTAQPAVDLVLALFDGWNRRAGDRTRDALDRSRRVAESDPSRTEQITDDVDDDHRLEIDMSYGGESRDDDYFRAKLTRR
jgi:hypothetical protein